MDILSLARINPLISQIKQLKSGALGAGASLIAYVASGVGGVAQTLRNVVDRALSVTPEDYGAVGDGVVEDSAAFQKALDAANLGNRRVYLTPGKIYKVKDIRPYDDITIWSDCAMGSGDGSKDLINRPQVTLAINSGASYVFDTGGTRGVQFRGIQINGKDRSVPCISAGFYRMTVDSCRIINGSYGIGGTGSNGSGSYCRGLQIHNSMIAANTIGLSNPIDSFASIAHFASNGTNVNASAGANSVGFSNCRFEWSTSGRNFNISGESTATVSRWTISNCQFDRGWLGSKLRYVDRWTITGCWFERANRAVSTVDDENCLLSFVYATNVSINGCVWARGADDAGGSVTTVAPDYAVFFGTGCDSISIQGGAVGTGFTSFARSASNCTNLTIRGIPGVRDFCNDPTKPTQDGPDVYRGRDATGAITAGGGTGTLTINTLLSLAAGSYTNRSLNLMISARNPSTGQAITGRFALTIRREAGAAAGVLTEILTKRPTLPAAYPTTTISATPTQAEVQAISTALTAMSNFIRTAPDIGLVGNGTLQVALTSVATDGSQVVLTVTNTDASINYSIQDARIVL